MHCKADDKVIGSLGLHESWINGENGYQHLKTKDVSFVLSKAYWGQGLMPEAVYAVIDCGFKFLDTGTYYAKLLDKHFDELRYILLKEE